MWSYLLLKLTYSTKDYQWRELLLYKGLGVARSVDYMEVKGPGPGLGGLLGTGLSHQTAREEGWPYPSLPR